MRQLTKLALSCALACGVFAPQTFAQNEESLSIRGGLWLPVDTTVKDVATIWFAAGVDVHLSTAFLPNSETVLSADYLTHSLGATPGNIFPLTINEYFYRPYGLHRAYFGLGAGAFVTDVKGSPSKTVFGLKGTLGVELDFRWFAELDYFWSDRFDTGTGARVNGIAAYIGFKL
jgi:hypothetical protein